MSKTTQATEQATEQDNSANVPAVNSLTAHADIFKRMADTPTENLSEETGDYFPMRENETYNFICHGLDTATIEDKVLQVVCLEDETGKKYIHGAVVLVNAMRKRTAFPCPIRIVTGSKKKTAKGSYLDLRVFTFGI